MILSVTFRGPYNNFVTALRHTGFGYCWMNGQRFQSLLRVADLLRRTFFLRQLHCEDRGYRAAHQVSVVRRIG